MGRRAFITGICGFAGSHLAEFLLEQGYEVAGIALSPREVSRWPARTEQTTIQVCDIRDAARLARIVMDLHPDEIYHLAAQSSVALSQEKPRATYEVNVGGTLNLLEAVRGLTPPPRLLVVGSAEEYGAVPPEQLPLREDSPLRPRGFYAWSKVAADLLAVQCAEEYGLPISRVRPFPHIGPRQSPQFACASFARQIALAEVGLHDPVIEVGDLTVRRDYTDVRDVVRAYGAVVTRGIAGEVYNICSERGPFLGEVVHTLLGLSSRPLSLREVPSRRRARDIPVLVGSAAKLRQDTGWRPMIPLEKSLEDLLAYWRGQIAVGDHS